VKLLKQTPAKKILTGANGRITGVIAENAGSEITIQTGCVILATGGYGGNRKLMKKYCAKYHDSMGLGWMPNMGDGLIMALETGAAMENPGTLLLSGPGAPGLIHINTGARKIHFPVMAVTLEPYSIWVNKNGLRFADEMVAYSHFLSSNTVVCQPGVISYTILDHKMMVNIEENGFLLGMGDPEGAQGNSLPGFINEVKALAKKDIVKVSGSWKKLAEWMGADPGVLKETVDEYNTACERGYDPVFAKERIYLQKICNPPYYIFKCGTDILNTIGGIKINEYMEVLDRNDDCIPGLYAVGVDTGGWMAEYYNGELSGSAYGFAVNSGRIAGENTAKYLGKTAVKR
jgi:fumarate reductase flavoprotein subunit